MKNKKIGPYTFFGFGDKLKGSRLRTNKANFWTALIDMDKRGLEFDKETGIQKDWGK